MRLELAYVASFLDCDGTVVIVASNRKRKKTGEGYVEYYAKAVFYNQNLGVICDLQETIGGAISPPNPSLDNFCLQLAPKATVLCLKRILPYLRIKREQALLALQLHKQISSSKRVSAHRLGTGGGHHLRDGVKEERRMLCERMRALNAKDAAEFRAFRTNWVNSGKPSMSEAILSQAAKDNGFAEGATASLVSSNNNLDQERPARKGRDSLSSVDDSTIH